MQTGLDDDTFKRVTDIVSEVCADMSSDIDQDKLLVLICLQLAYKLEKFSGSLESLDRRLNDITLGIKTEGSAVKND
jgi:hypothetical protein